MIVKSDITQEHHDIEVMYEKRFLKDFIGALKILKAEHGRKMELTGLLVERISHTLHCSSDALFFAGYYANIGLLMLEKITSRADFISSEHEQNSIKEHVYYSAHFLEKRGLHSSAKIVELHHEKPNARGYFNVMNKNQDAAIVNIADEFVGLASESNYRPYRVKKIAVQIALKHYEASTLFTREEKRLIEEVLNDFYPRIRGIDNA
jgi:response regulator RpfG family c-di-GMP phosphodiesterase